MSDKSIYLDYAAATPLDERVLDVMRPYLGDRFYNPSAMYGPARSVRDDLEAARQAAAATIGAKPSELVFTAGATESINLAIRGVIDSYGGKVVVSSIEHEAVMAAASLFESVEVPADAKGYVGAQAVADRIDDQVTLVSIGYVNSELGTVQPIKDIAKVVATERQRRFADGNKLPLWLHSDASQATGLLDTSVARLGVDLMTLNSGKCYGPKQVGLLWCRPGIELTPIIKGGGQEGGVRSGTENVAGVIGFAKALQLASDDRKTESNRLRQLRDRLQQKIESGVKDLVVNGYVKKRSPHILHVSVPGLDGERAVYALDQMGVMATTGSACAANRQTRSHVLEAVGMSDEMADGSLRFSLGRFTTEKAIDQAATIITQAIERERGL